VTSLSIGLLAALGWVGFGWLGARADAAQLRTQIDLLQRRLARRER
jgi:hypothetical protein